MSKENMRHISPNAVRMLAPAVNKETPEMISLLQQLEALDNKLDVMCTSVHRGYRYPVPKTEEWRELNKKRKILEKMYVDAWEKNNPKRMKFLGIDKYYIWS
jgi:hypothetical protein